MSLPRSDSGSYGSNQKQRRLDEIAWIEEIRSQLQKEHHSLQKVKGYLKKFHKTYPDIKDFQKQIESDLLMNGYSDNIFGRRCRSEIIPHMDMTQADIKVGIDLWYRVKFIKLALDKKGVDCLILGGHELKVIVPKKKRFPTISDLKFELGKEIYCLDEKKLSTIWANFRSSRDSNQLIEDMMRLHADSSWDSGDLFDALNAISPSQSKPFKIIVDRPLYPYCRILDSLIRRVLVGEKENNFVIYPGYDALRRKLISQRVSSTLMDICKIAMFEARKEFQRRWPDLRIRPRIVNCIHDEAAIECRAEDSEEVKKSLVETMESASTYLPYLFNPNTLPVKIEVEAKIGLNYAEAKP